ncbi:MAG: M24 family metallopeptidase [Planctomycetota bacterium]
MKEQVAANYEKVKRFLADYSLDGIVLASRANFSWFTAGKLNYVNAAGELGVAALLITKDNCICVTNNIEHARIQQEEMDGTGIEVRSAEWFNAAATKKLWKELTGSDHLAADIDVTGLGLQRLPADFMRLRYELSQKAVDQYEELGKLAAACLEHTAKNIKKGSSEFEIAAMISHYCLSNGTRPWVILVAADERIKKYRHPIMTTARAEKMAEMILCLEQYGLIVSATRLVSFGPVDSEIAQKHQAVVNIDTAFIKSTVPGAKMSDVFTKGVNAYAENGYPGEWKLHHQGGPTGYAPRDFVATFDTDEIVTANQAFAWNPSITGTKSEDTIVATHTGQIIVSQAIDWPMIEGKWQGKKLLRPAILIR